MTAQEQFERLIRDTVWPGLRPLGFKRKGTTFGLRGSGLWGVINFQKDRHSTADEVAFTINLGVRTDFLASHEAAGIGPAPSEKVVPAEMDCQWRQRIGWFLPQKRDVWWRIPASGDERLELEIARLIIDVAVPVLRRLRTQEALLGEAAIGALDRALLVKRCRTDQEFQAAAADALKWAERRACLGYWRSVLEREGFRETPRE